MSYARNLLSRGEEVVHESRQHWFAIIARTWVWVVVAILAIALLVWRGTNALVLDNDTVDGAVMIAGVVALLAAAGFIGMVLWDWRNQEWLVTTRRVIKADGILNKNMSDSGLEKINDARLSQSLMGRIFNYGTLEILTAAEEIGGDLGDFPMLADPVQFKVAMLNQKELLERPDLAPPRYQRQAPLPEMQRAAAMPPRAGSDRVAEVRGDGETVPTAPPPVAGPSSETSAGEQLTRTLESLAALRDKGLITPEEYDAKKSDLLERM